MWLCSRLSTTPTVMLSPVLECYQDRERTLETQRMNYEWIVFLRNASVCRQPIEPMESLPNPLNDGYTLCNSNDAEAPHKAISK